MRTARDKQVVVGADLAGYPLKEYVRKHLIGKGWEVTDLTPVKDEAPMYQRVGFMLGSRIAEGEFEKAMGGFWIAPRLGMAMADAFLEGSLGDGYEGWEGCEEYHELGYRECEDFDYEAYRANGFAVVNPREAALGPEPEGLAF